MRRSLLSVLLFSAVLHLSFIPSVLDASPTTAPPILYLSAPPPDMWTDVYAYQVLDILEPSINPADRVSVSMPAMAELPGPRRYLIQPRRL